MAADHQRDIAAVHDRDEAVVGLEVLAGVRPEEGVDVVLADQVLVGEDQAVHAGGTVDDTVLDPVQLVDDVGVGAAGAVGTGELVQHDDAEVLVVEGVGQALEQLRGEGEVGGASQHPTHSGRLREQDRQFAGGRRRGLMVAAEGEEPDPRVVERRRSLSLERQGANGGLVVVGVVLDIHVVPDLDHEPDVLGDELLVHQLLDAGGGAAGVLAVQVGLPLGVGHEAEGQVTLT
ncbi:hypothetical protein M3G03_03440 [Aestuariimicrobium sp. p3-SID1156]|nr:hypothetical protein [Aestuariimicrobium sp. p3-SID1156]MCT1458604.1 hypothetical protein [Aestuariimicrobium sp. p3-SID1156]